jgi:hypothetical protein
MTLRSEQLLGLPLDEQLLYGAFDSESLYQVDRILEVWVTEGECTDHGTPGEQALEAVVYSGSLDVIQRVYNRVSQGRQQQFLAIIRDHYDAHYSAEVCCYFQGLIAADIAARGDIDRLCWQLHQWQQRGVSEHQYSTQHLRAAAENGQLAMCKHLRTEQCPWDATVCDAAARSDDPAVLKWLRESGCPCKLQTAVAAATHKGSVKVLDYLVNELSVPVETVFALASGAAFQTLMWLRAKCGGAMALPCVSQNIRQTSATPLGK